MTPRYLPGEEHPHQHIADQHTAAYHAAEAGERIDPAVPTWQPREQQWRDGIECEPLTGWDE